MYVFVEFVMVVVLWLVFGRVVGFGGVVEVFVVFVDVEEGSVVLDVGYMLVWGVGSFFI